MSNLSSKSSLPDLPHPEFLRKQAKARLADLRLRMPAAKLGQVQLVMAREYGFASWAALQAEVVRRHASPQGQWGRIRRSPMATLPQSEAPMDGAGEPNFLHAGVATQIGFILTALVGVVLVMIVGGGFAGMARQIALLAHR